MDKNRKSANHLGPFMDLSKRPSDGTKDLMRLSRPMVSYKTLMSLAFTNSLMGIV